MSFRTFYLLRLNSSGHELPLVTAWRSLGCGRKVDVGARAAVLFHSVNLKLTSLWWARSQKGGAILFESMTMLGAYRIWHDCFQKHSQAMLLSSSMDMEINELDL